MWSNHQGIGSLSETSCFNVLGVCRLCMLEGCSNMEFIFRSAVPNSIANKITSVTRLLLIEGDGLPAMVCQQCLFQLDVADTFIRRCSQSDRSFRNRLTEGVCEMESARLESLAASDLNTIAALARSHQTTDIVDPDLEATNEQDPDEHATEFSAIKLEVEDDAMDNEVDAAYFEYDGGLQQDEFAENFTMDTICIKMEEIDVAELPDDGTELDCSGLPAVPEDNALPQHDVIQTLPEVVKFKCSKCSLEFSKKCGLTNHHKFHLRQQKNTKIFATKRRSIFKKQSKDTNDMGVVHGSLSETDLVNLTKNSNVQGVDECPLPKSDNGKVKEVAPRKVTVPQLPTNVFKCTLCQLNFPSRRSLKVHCLRAKAHKDVLKSTETSHQQGHGGTTADQQVKNKRAISNSQNVCIDKQVTQLTAKPADHDLSANTVTADGHRSVLQPQRNKILAGTKKFQCSRCSLKFLTKHKRASHICNVTDNRERNLQRHLRIRVPRTKSDSIPEPQNHTGQVTTKSPSLECADIQENTSENPEVSSELLLSTLPMILGGHDDVAQYHQNHDVESPLNVLSATKPRKRDSEALMQPKNKLLKEYKCKICSLEFSVQLQLARHMRLAEGHNKWKNKPCPPMKTFKNKPVENKGQADENLSMAKSACDAAAISQVPELSASDSLLEKETNDNPKKASEFLSALPIILGGHDDAAQDHLENSLNVLSATKLRKRVSQKLAEPKTKQLKKIKCKICLEGFSVPIQLARHMRMVKGHNTWKGKRFLSMKTRRCKPVKEPKPAENKGHTAKKLSVAKRASDAVATSKMPELSVLDALKKEQTDVNPKKASELLPALPIILGGHVDAAQDLQKDNLESSLNVLSATKLRKTDSETLAKPKTKQLKMFKCKICLEEFSLPIQLARHMRLTKGHNIWKDESMNIDKTKPLKEPKPAENKGQQSFAKSSEGAVAVPKVAELSANDFLLEKTKTGEPGGVFAVNLPLSRDQNASTHPTAGTDNEPVTQEENRSLVTDSQHVQCASCLLMFSSPLKLAQHVCNTISQANAKEGIHGRLSRVLTKTKLKKKPQPTATSEEIASFDFHSQTNVCNEVAAVSKKRVVATLDHTEDGSPMPVGITKSSGTFLKILPVPIHARANPTKVLSLDIMNNEPIKHQYKSNTVQQQCSSISTDETRDCYGQIANGKGSKRSKVSPVISEDEKQNALPLPNAVGNNVELRSDERFLGNQKLSSLQQDTEGIQNILNRKLCVQLNRLSMARDEKNKGAIDSMLPTRSKSFCPITEEACNSHEITAKSKKNQIMSNGCSDLNDIKKETVCLSTTKKQRETEEGNKSLVDECDWQPEVVKYTCNVCFSDFVSAVGLRNHSKTHKKMFLRKRFLGKANESDSASAQAVRSSNVIVSVSDMQQDVVISRQQCNAMADSVTNGKQMQVSKVALTCLVCSVQFSTDIDLARHEKCHEKHKNLTRVRKTRLSLSEA